MRYQIRTADSQNEVLGTVEALNQGHAIEIFRQTGAPHEGPLYAKDVLSSEEEEWFKQDRRDEMLLDAQADACEEDYE